MPAQPQRPPSRRDSWPPTQVRLQSSSEQIDVPAEEHEQPIDEDPLVYFLTPAPLLQDDINEDSDMMDFEFDAGIEGAKPRRDIVRSVSPSSLNGLALPPPRPPTPPRSPPAQLFPDAESATDEEEEVEDDGEDYFHPGSGRFLSLRVPFSLRDFGNMKAKKGALAATVAKGPSQPSTSGRPRPAHTVSSPAVPPSSRRGRPTAHSRGRSYSTPARRRSPRTWREPSPDVWSIEEETEEEVLSDAGSGVMCEQELARERGKEESAQTMNNSPARPKKRVRFVLPVKEI